MLHHGRQPMNAPFWSPHGDRLYFIGGYGSLRSIATVGGEPRTEIDGIRGADLAPDGETFALIKETDAPGGATQLMLGPVSDLRPYQRPLKTSACTPNLLRFTPDGERLLVWDACSTSGAMVLALRRAATTPPREIGVPVGAATSVAATQPGGAWLPDSRHFVLAHAGTLWLASVDRGVIARLTNGTTAAMFPHAARDGTIAFTEYVTDHDVIEIPLDGSTPTTLVGSSWYDGSPAWSPRGDRFAYVADRGRGDEIRVRTIQDGSERRVLGVGDFPERIDSLRAITYSPNGHWLAMNAFTLGAQVHSGIWIAPAGGGTPRLVTPRDQMAIRASWSPDGRALAVDTVAGAAVEIWVIGVGTSELPRRLQFPPAVDVHFAEWSPAGRGSPCSTAATVPLERYRCSSTPAPVTCAVCHRLESTWWRGRQTARSSTALRPRQALLRFARSTSAPPTSERSRDSRRRSGFTSWFLPRGGYRCTPPAVP